MKMKLVAPTNQWGSIMTGAIVAGIGVALTYILQHMAIADLGPWGPMVAGVLSVVANILRKCVEIDLEAAIRQ